MKSPKRQCTDYRSILVERNSFTSPVKDRLLAFGNVKSKMLPPPLQSAFARYILVINFFFFNLNSINLVCFS